VQRLKSRLFLVTFETVIHRQNVGRKIIKRYVSMIALEKISINKACVFITKDLILINSFLTKNEIMKIGIMDEKRNAQFWAKSSKTRRKLAK